MLTSILKCEYCGEIYNGETDDLFICQTCGSKNYLKDISEGISKIKKEIEYILGQSIEEVKEQLSISGDASARDFLFNKHYKPKIDIHFEDITERFGDYFRRPLISIDLIKRLDTLFDVEKVFDQENTKGFDPEIIKELTRFAFGTLNDDVMKLMAANPKSKQHIDVMQEHINFLSKLYLIRGTSLNLTEEKLVHIMKIIEKAIEICSRLVEKYQQIEGEQINVIKFQSWNSRLKINLEIRSVFELCFQKKYNEVPEKIEEIINQIDQSIAHYRKQYDENPDSYPLYITMIIIEGFSVDKKISQILLKLSNFIYDNNFELDFILLIEELNGFLDISDTPFNNVKLEGVWDPDWIKNLEDPIDRIFQIFDNINNNLGISSGKTPVKVLKPDFNIPGDWLAGNTVITKNLDKSKFNIGESFQIKNSLFFYYPIASLNVYAILKKGFIRKGGDEFESFLLVNPFFRLDQRINSYEYPKAFGFIDIEKKLKEKDILSQNLNFIEDIMENGNKELLPPGSNVLPLITTQIEIEEFVQKTYDLFQLAKEGGSYGGDFKKNYKNAGIAKNLEQLSGELVDYIYVPTLLLELAEGKSKKDVFQPKEEYKYRLLMPFNTNPKNPWNSLVRMDINPDFIFRLLDQIKKFH